jgi:iron(II)-dependent oxidoreductase
VDVDALPEGASAYGALHLVGNVWEWTATGRPLVKKKGLGGVFQRPRKGHRVLKGGGYAAAVADLAPTGRFHASEETASPLYGFRCAYDP